MSWKFSFGGGCCCGCRDGDLESQTEDFATDPGWQSQASFSNDWRVTGGQLELYGVDNFVGAPGYEYYYQSFTNVSDFATLTAEIDFSLGTLTKGYFGLAIAIGESPSYSVPAGDGQISILYPYPQIGVEPNFLVQKKDTLGFIDTGTSKYEPVRFKLDVQRTGNFYDVSYEVDDSVVESDNFEGWYTTDSCLFIGAFAYQFRPPFSSGGVGGYWDNYELTVT